MGDTLQRFWRLTVSDDVTVQRDGAVTFVPGRKVAALLAYLAIEGPTPRALLADLLWPLAASPRNSLRQAVHALRKRAPIADGDPLRLSTDVRVDEGEGDLLSAYDLSDCAELHAWTEFQVERRRVARIERWAAEADRLEAEGRMGEALAAARRALAVDRLSELAHRRVIRLAYLAGDRAAALDAYHRCVEMLRVEFGVRPLPETVALARDVEAATVQRRPRPKPRIPMKVARPPLLAGREDAWARMEEAWANGQVVYISGVAGIGKSRLMHAFAESKVPRVRWNAFQARPGDATAPYATQARALRVVLDGCPGIELTPIMRRELSRLIPALSDRPPAPMTSLEEKQFFYATVAEFLILSVRWLDVWVADDWQFVDAASLEMANYMFARITPQATGREGQYALCTFRTHEVDDAFRAFLADLVRSDTAIHVELGPLSAEAVEALLASTAVDGAQAFAATLHRITGGNPLFVIETLKGLLEAGDLDISELGDLLPARVAEVLEVRFRRLSVAQFRFLQLLAVAQTDASPDLIRTVLRVGDESLSTVRTALEEARLIEGLAFSHDLVYTAVRATTPAPVRAMLHRRAGDALAATNGNAARIAYHYEQAGETNLALPHLLAAAEEAQVRGAFRQAVDWYGKVRDLDASSVRAGRAEDRLEQLDGLLGAE